MNAEPDVSYSSSTYGYAPPRRRRGFLGPLVSVAGVIAFAAVVFIGFGGGDGQVTTDGTVPLIHADTSPTKLRPEQPGGMEVPFQDKLVFERLGGGGRVPVERLLPPAEEPLPRPLVAPALPPPPLAPTPPALVQVLPAPPGGEPAEEGAPFEADPVRPYVAEQAAPIAVPAPPPPPPRIAAVAPPPAPPPAATQPGKTGGAWRVQLASVRSEAEAQAEWRRLSGRHGDVLKGLSLQVARADLGAKGVYYRVQGAGTDEAGAREVCAKLAVLSVGCVVVRP